jgi:ribonuclease Y
VVFAVAAVLYARRVAEQASQGRGVADTQLDARQQSVEQEAQQILVGAREEAFRIRGAAEAEVRERRAEVARVEQRNSQREEAHERRLRELEQSEQRLTRREEELEELRQTTESERGLVTRELERVAALSQPEARAELLAGVEAELDSEVAERIRAADQRVREEASERSREILIAAMQRHASDQTGESSVTVMHLPSDDLKGRIIGREGRNIRALEAATGVDVIVDETPESVVLSGFDPVRREVARVTLERLFADGRIHPARIEEMVGKSRGCTRSWPSCSAPCAFATRMATTCSGTARTPRRSPA